MPLVLTTNALVQCVHGGLGTTAPLTPIWSVNGGFVTAEGDTGALACPFLLCPCVGYTLKSMNLNASQLNGRQVILVTDFQQSFTGLPLILTDFHQTHDDSTPAPIPVRQPAPPASPAMADLVSPIVSAAPPSTPFSLTTTPTPAVITYTLTSEHPLRWILTLINSFGQSSDLTSGAPGMTVTPSGGSWTSPSLTVTITMPKPFVATLGTGTSYLYLSGVSARGLSGFGEATIVVST